MTIQKKKVGTSESLLTSRSSRSEKQYMLVNVHYVSFTDIYCFVVCTIEVRGDVNVNHMHKRVSFTDAMIIH